MIDVLFVIDGNVIVEKIDGNLTHDDLLKLAQEKGAKGCYVIMQTIIKQGD